LGKSKKPKPTFSASFPGLVDLVVKDGIVRYLIKEEGKLKIESNHRNASGKTLVQPPDLSAIPFSLPEASEVTQFMVENDHELYWDIYEKLKTVSQLPSEDHYHLVTVYVFFTYIQEGFDYFPILWFFGLPERGKSRILKAVIHLSYRGYYTETLNEAHIFRFSDLFKGTLGLDVFDLIKRTKAKGSHDLLLGRFEKGMVVPRVTNFEKGSFQDTQYYKISGPTVFATNVEIPADDPLRSRCLQITMPEARGKYPNNNTVEALAEFKARLIAFRARHLEKTFPEVEKPVAGRLGDITHPLVCSATLLPIEATEGLMALITDLENERQDNQADTAAWRIVKGLYDLRDEVKNGRLSVAGLKDAVNMVKYEEDGYAPLSIQLIGRELNALGIKRRKSMGIKRIIWNRRLMDKLWDRYGIPEQEYP